MKIYKINSDLSLTAVSRFKRRFWFSVTINLLLLTIAILQAHIEPVKHVVEKLVPYHINHENDVKLTDSAVQQELIKEGCILPTVAIKQCQWESGHYKSPICKENKNLFGIKYHKCVWVTGQNRGHATYKSYRDNIKCYISIQNLYLHNIDGHYAQSKDYIKVLKSN